MKLKFPPLAGGITQGLNDAGIETFEGDYAHYVVRECAQNSLDAAASTHEPVEMEIAMSFLPADELPFIKELRDTLDQCRVFWRGDEKAGEFFNRAFRLAKAKEIPLLRISDFGTTGVPGGDEQMNRLGLVWFAQEAFRSRMTQPVQEHSALVRMRLWQLLIFALLFIQRAPKKAR
jgi:hypothetical protein